MTNFENRTWLSWTDLRFDVAGPVSEEVLNNPTDVYRWCGYVTHTVMLSNSEWLTAPDWQVNNQAIGAGVWHSYS